MLHPSEVTFFPSFYKASSSSVEQAALSCEFGNDCNVIVITIAIPAIMIERSDLDCALLDLTLIVMMIVKKIVIDLTLIAIMIVRSDLKCALLDLTLIVACNGLFS